MHARYRSLSHCNSQQTTEEGGKGDNSSGIMLNVIISADMGKKRAKKIEGTYFKVVVVE